jgi:glycosyltransferase involved in cell wall biosynthesis
MSTPRRLLFVVNQLDFFLSHRLPLALEAQLQGYEVHVATAASGPAKEVALQGLVHHPIPLQRGGVNPGADLRLLWSLICLFWRLRPQIVHLVTIKPAIYGGLAARCLRIPGVVMAISGLGFVFVRQGVRARLLQSVVKALYRIAVGGGRVCVIFQNREDQRVFQSFTALRANQMVLIPGSGVPLARYRYTPELAGTLVVTMAARLLVDKGVFEFVAAAEQLRGMGFSARFCLAGDLDPDNPASCTADDMRRWREAGVVELLGHCSDIPQLFASSHIVVLPSYREGMPRVLLEAAACGRVVVTTDVAGCRDAIEPGVTGLLVPAQDVAGLVAAIRTLLTDTALRQSMGEAGRSKAEREFDIAHVVTQHMQLYAEVMG